MADFSTNRELKNNSTLQSYLTNAKAELDLQNTIINNSKLESLRNITEEIDERNLTLNSNFDLLYQKRNILYENLISVIIYKRYLSIINENVEIHKISLDNLKVLNNKILLNNINEVASILSLNDSRINNKLNDYKDYFNDLFEKEKLLLGYNNIKKDENGNLTNINNAYNINNIDSFSGTFKFKNDSFGSFEERILQLGNENSIDVELTNTKDIRVECGDEDSPYIISDGNDTRLEASDYYQKQTTLALNNRIVLDIPKKQTKSIGNLYTTIKGNKNIFEINVKEEKTTLNFFAKYDETQFLIKGTGELDIKIGNFDDNILKGITIDESQSTIDDNVYGARFYFSGFSKVNIYFTSGTSIGDETTRETLVNMLKSDIEKVLKHSFFISGQPEKKPSITVVGAILNSLFPSTMTLEFNSESQEITGSKLPIDNVKITDNSSTPDEKSGIAVNNTIISANKGKFKISSAKRSGNIIKDKDNDNKVVINENGKILKFYFAKYKTIDDTDENLEKSIDLEIDATNANFKLVDSNIDDYNNDDLNILAGLAKLADNPSLSSIPILKEALSNKKKELSSSLSSIANIINKSYLSIEQIMANRNANDSGYNYDYIEDIQAKILEASSYLSILLQTETDQINTDLYFDKMANANEIVENSCDDLLIGIIYSITRLNYIIENYSAFFKPSADYENSFREMINTTYDAITSISNNDYYQSYGGVRSFNNKWETKLLEYTDSGIFDIGPLYITYELGSNLFKIKLYKLVNDRLISIYKKGLFKDPYNTDVFKYEKELYDEYKIKVNENPGYETLPPVLTDEISELALLNNIDIVECLHSLENKKIKKLLEMIEMIIAKYLANNNDKFLIKIQLIKNILDNTENNFKVLIVKYAFYTLINSLIDKENYNSSQLEILQKYKTDKDYKKIISKYISVWNLKFYSFIDDNSALLILGGEDFSKFVSNKLVETKNDSPKTILELTVNTIKNLWEGLIDFWNKLGGGNNG